MDAATLVIPPAPVTPLRWEGDARTGALLMLDQTRLPQAVVWLRHDEPATVIAAIRRLAVRGAPAIGIAGAYALALAARQEAARAADAAAFADALEGHARRIAAARPTAVNLPAAVSRHMRLVGDLPGGPANIAQRLLEAAQDLERYEREACAAMGRFGAAWLWGRTRFLTHCNAGSLVTSGIGTALAPIYVLQASGQDVHVSVDESRPLLQGLRLTAYELSVAGIPHQVLVDGAAASLLRSGAIDAVITGADRICANGDVVNKIGTYGLALAAREHGVPFMVVAPLSTLDPTTARGADVPIEQRPADQRAYLDASALPTVLPAYAPAFDATPADLIRCLVSETGVIEDPDKSRLKPWLSAAASLQMTPRSGR